MKAKVKHSANARAMERLEAARHEVLFLADWFSSFTTAAALKRTWQSFELEIHRFTKASRGVTERSLCRGYQAH
jgi:hypothetical protein